MSLIKKFGNFFKSDPRKEYLLNLINKQIKLSKDEFDLNILPKDQYLEREIIPKIILTYWDQIKTGDYSKLFSRCVREVKLNFEPQLKYYFIKTPPGETRTRYDCHLESIVAAAFIYISNERN